jgi:hypothetical protein
MILLYNNNNNNNTRLCRTGNQFRSKRYNITINTILLEYYYCIIIIYNIHIGHRVTLALFWTHSHKHDRVGHHRLSFQRVLWQLRARICVPILYVIIIFYVHYNIVITNLYKCVALLLQQ